MFTNISGNGIILYINYDTLKQDKKNYIFNKIKKKKIEDLSI